MFQQFHEAARWASDERVEEGLVFIGSLEDCDNEGLLEVLADSGLGGGENCFETGKKYFINE